jgi:uncharacterized protein (TIGR03437 family)
MLNCLRLAVILALACLVLNAQDVPVSTVRIGTDPIGGRFYVDGQMYQFPQVFTWPQGSKHVVQFPLEPNPDGTTTGCQPGRDGTMKFCFDGWTDSTGTLTPRTAPTQVVTASPSLTFLTARVSIQYRIALRFMDLPAGALAVDCAGAPSNTPQDHLRSGVVFLDGQCYGSSTDIWLQSGARTLNAFPFPGFVFRGWNINGQTADSFLKAFNVDRAMTIAADFVPAKRVRFVTDPPGLKLLIDRTPTPTKATDSEDNLSTNFPGCEATLNLPPRPPITVPALCFGEFDFLPGSKHVLAAVSPQVDDRSRYWVFDRFSNGLGLNGVYTADFNTSVTEVITAKFAPGVQVAFLTSPPGLKLNVDGRENWPSYTFMWGANTTHTVTAPASQVDAKGRRWMFQGWSNGGPATQEILADASSGNGVRMTAMYTALGQVKILSNPPGIPLTIDGEECETPCAIDRDAGTNVTVAAPATVPIDESSRLQFLGWSDGEPLVRSYTVGPESATVFANYGHAYRMVVSSDPAEGVDVQAHPGSADGFYPADSVVTLTAEARPGFRFRRWLGDLEGTYHTGQVLLSGPRQVVAALDRVPHISPAGIRNGAGDTPETGVAAGSIITIFGESLAPRLEAGPANPLAQTIADVVVTVNERILPLMFVSPQQINAQLLSDLPAGEHTLLVRWTGKPDVTGKFTVVRNAPGLFNNPGEGDTTWAVASHADGSPITPESPAKRGEVITIYGTGFGPLAPRFMDGFAFPQGSNHLVADPVEIKLGDRTFRPERSGGAAGMVGAIATRIRIPDDTPSGSAELTVSVNGKVSNRVVLPVE